MDTLFIPFQERLILWLTFKVSLKSDIFAKVNFILMTVLFSKPLKETSSTEIQTISIHYVWLQRHGCSSLLFLWAATEDDSVLKNKDIDEETTQNHENLL